MEVKKIIPIISFLILGFFIACKKNNSTFPSTDNVKLLCYDSIIDNQLKDYLYICIDSISKEKKHTVSFRGGVKHGTAIKYYKNEKTEIIENYQSGVLEGWSRKYNLRGDIIYEKFYRKGNPVYTNIEGVKDYTPYLEYPINTIKDSTYNFFVYFLPKPERGSLVLDFGMNDCDSKNWELHRVHLDDYGNAVQPFFIDFIGETCIGSQISDSADFQLKYNHKHKKILATKN